MDRMDVNAKEAEGKTLLHRAVTKETAQEVILLALGADVNAQDNNGTTPLHEAAFSDSPETAKILLDHGADVNVINNEGDIPLSVALLRDSSKTADVLLEHREDANAMNKKNDTIGERTGCLFGLGILGVLWILMFFYKTYARFTS